MALEDEIKGLRSDIQALTAALAGGKAPAAAGGKAADKKGAAAPTKTAEEVTEMAVRVKKEKGTDAAKALIKSHGKADELKNVKPENYDALFAACEAALAETAEEDGI